MLSPPVPKQVVGRSKPLCVCSKSAMQTLEGVWEALRLLYYKARSSSRDFKSDAPRE